MLFRRFSLVTASIAVLGIMVANLIEATHTQKRGFALQDRLKQWEIHDTKKACDHNPKLCLINETVSIVI